MCVDEAGGIEGWGGAVECGGRGGCGVKRCASVIILAASRDAAGGGDDKDEVAVAVVVVASGGGGERWRAALKADTMAQHEPTPSAPHGALHSITGLASRQTLRADERRDTAFWC